MWPSRVVRDHRLTRFGLLAGFVLAALLIVTILIRYPGNGDTAVQYASGGIAALLVLLGIGGWTALRGTRTRSERAAATLRLGTAAGLLFGVLWAIEIGVVNFLVAPGIMTSSLRDPVSIGAVAVVAGLTVVLGAISAFRARRVTAGVRAGFWSGLVSGLISCLTGLLLVVVFMGLLLRDPLTIREWAERGAASGAPDAATYWAYETMTGALVGHLILEGIVIGTLLGTLGGVFGKLLAAARGRRTPAT